MEIDPVFLVAAATLFAASYLQSATGFGGAILCMAILPLVLSIHEAVNFVTVSSLAVTLMIVFANRSGLSLKNAGPLCLGMMLGIPIGYYSLRQLDDTLVVRGLGAILMLISLSEFLSDKISHWKIPRRAGTGFGLIGGILAGAYNVGGPPLVAYVFSRKWSKVEMIATLQAVFIAGVVVRNLLMLGGGDFSYRLLILVAISTPAAAVAVWLGKLTLDRLPLSTLKKVVFSLIFVIGLKYVIVG